MPSDLLPRRPYVELPPPPDGFGAAVAEARRRRRRKALAAAAGASATAAVVGVLLLVTGGGAGGDAILRPAPVPVPPAGDVSSPAPHAAASSPASAPAPGLRAPAAPGSYVGPAPGTTAHSQAAPPVSGGRAPAIVLTRTRGSYTGSPRVCRTGDTLDDSSFTPGQNWCTDVAATTVAGGVRLSLTMCRDSTSSGTLTFASSRELDFAVKRGATVVWAWSHDHPGAASPHTLDTKADGCWIWSLVWPDVTQSGASAGHGAFTMVATSTAHELRGDPSETVTFDY